MFGDADGTREVYGSVGDGGLGGRCHDGARLAEGDAISSRPTFSSFI